MKDGARLGGKKKKKKRGRGKKSQLSSLAFSSNGSIEQLPLMGFPRLREVMLLHLFNLLI